MHCSILPPFAVRRGGSLAGDRGPGETTTGRSGKAEVNGTGKAGRAGADAGPFLFFIFIFSFDFFF